MQKIPIKIDTNTLSITDDLDTTDTSDDLTYRVHLDNSKIITALMNKIFICLVIAIVF